MLFIRGGATIFFETKDLIVDELRVADAVRFHEICNQTFVLKWMKDWEHSIQEIQNLISFFIQGYSVMCPGKHVLALAIRLKMSNELIGICGFGVKAELGGNVEICYFIDEKHSNKGYMSQVISKAIKFYFDLTHENYLYAIVDKNNLPSYQLLKKNGFIIYSPDNNFCSENQHYKLYKQLS